MSLNIFNGLRWLVNVLYVCTRYSYLTSLFKDGLGTLFEFASSFVVQLLLLGYRSGSVRLSSAVAVTDGSLLGLTWSSIVSRVDCTCSSVVVRSICHLALSRKYEKMRFIFTKKECALID